MSAESSSTRPLRIVKAVTSEGENSECRAGGGDAVQMQTAEHTQCGVRWRGAQGGSTWVHGMLM